MLQRKQTLFLLVPVIFSLLSSFVLAYAADQNAVLLYVKDAFFLNLLFISTAFLSTVTIFLFRYRKVQLSFCWIIVVLNLAILGIFAYRLLVLLGDFFFSEKGIGLFIPFLSIAFLVLAIRAISQDEKLVRSVDRLR